MHANTLVRLVKEVGLLEEAMGMDVYPVKLGTIWLERKEELKMKRKKAWILKRAMEVEQNPVELGENSVRSGKSGETAMENGG